MSKLVLRKGKERYDFIIQLTISQPSVSITEHIDDKSKRAGKSSDSKTSEKRTVMTTENQPEKEDWRLPIREAIKSMVNSALVQDKMLVKKVAQYVLIGEDLYKRGSSTPLLKCLNSEQVEYVMNELHNGTCVMHCGQKTPAAKIIRAGYYWPTVCQDCSEYVKKCKDYQENGLLIHQLSIELHSIRSPWPFAKWGMDIVRPFLPASKQRRFLIMAIDYFTKWIEADL